jgi:hypothetical protein
MFQSIAGESPGLVVLDQQSPAQFGWMDARELQLIAEFSARFDLLNARQWTQRRYSAGVAASSVMEYRSLISGALSARRWKEPAATRLAELERQFPSLDLMHRTRISCEELIDYDWQTEQSRLYAGETAG